MSRLFPTDRPWAGWQKFLFRFIFTFLLLALDLPGWLSGIAGEDNSVYQWYSEHRNNAVKSANAHFFHIRPELVAPMGSGDTSFAWALICFSLCVATLVALSWSLADRRRPNYERLGYWFRNFLRYYLASVAFGYGIVKITLSQMGTLSLVDLATPVGNLSLMRMCWYFMAASPPYQIFSGVMEVIVALLLLYRRTVTFGLLMGLAVFANVMVLNLTYDIPVKIFSGELVLCCIVLLFREYDRLLAFLVLNQPAARGNLYDPPSRNIFFRLVRWVLKLTFLVLVIIIPGWTQMKNAHASGAGVTLPAIPPGVYDITGFVHTTYSLLPVTRPWTRLVFDKNGQGSMTGDSTRLKYRYGRSLFTYHAAEGLPQTVVLKTRLSDNPIEDAQDSLVLHYEPVAPDQLQFRAQIGRDSVRFDAKKSDHPYPLGQWQFHWLTEYVP